MLSTSASCVYLVDDDEDDRLLVELIFKQYSPECRLATFEDGEDLLETLIQGDSLPSLILLDMNMPRLDGFGALAWIRQQAHLKELPVVMLTTSSNPEDRAKAAQLGADDFMTKPVTLQALSQLVLQIRQRWLLGRCAPLAFCA